MLDDDEAEPADADELAKKQLAAKVAKAQKAVDDNSKKMQVIADKLKKVKPGTKASAALSDEYAELYGESNQLLDELAAAKDKAAGLPEIPKAKPGIAPKSPAGVMIASYEKQKKALLGKVQKAISGGTQGLDVSETYKEIDELDAKITKLKKLGAPAAEEQAVKKAEQEFDELTKKKNAIKKKLGSVNVTPEGEAKKNSALPPKVSAKDTGRSYDSIKKDWLAATKRVQKINVEENGFGSKLQAAREKAKDLETELLDQGTYDSAKARLMQAKSCPIDVNAASRKTIEKKLAGAKKKTRPGAPVAKLSKSPNANYPSEEEIVKAANGYEGTMDFLDKQRAILNSPKNIQTAARIYSKDGGAINFRHMNAPLRQHIGKNRPRQLAEVLPRAHKLNRALQGALMNAPKPPPPVVVWRAGGQEGLNKILEAGVGNSVPLNGFISTTVSPLTANNTRIRYIIAPRNGAWIKPVSHHSYENEFALPHQQSYTVMGITRDPKNKHVTVELMQNDPVDDVDFHENWNPLATDG